MIDPSVACLFIPSGLNAAKKILFDRIAGTVGHVIRGDYEAIGRLPDNIIPIIGCTYEFWPMIQEWNARGRAWVYWDNAYTNRVGLSWLRRGHRGSGSYRFECSAYQMKSVRAVQSDRWNALEQRLKPWRRGGTYIIVAAPSPTYQRFHRIDGWTQHTKSELRKVSDRPIIVREKDCTVTLEAHCNVAHMLVTHGSNVAVEAAILGCPVCVDLSSAAAHVGITDIAKVEEPVYPDREPWAWSLAYSQYRLAEILDGTMWPMLQ